MRLTLKWLVILSGTSLSAFTLGALLGHFHWLLDVLSHFHLQYAALLGLCLAASLLLRARILALCLLPALLVNLFLLAPFFVPRSDATAVVASSQSTRQSTSQSTTPYTLSVMTLNVYMDNRDYSAISDYLREEAADVVMLSENKPALMRVLKETLSDLYPHIYDESTRGTYGLALLSRYPFEAARSVPLGRRGRRLIEVTLRGQTPVTLFGAHPLPPLGSRWAERRNDELIAVERLIQQSAKPVVLLGDFNASPWSYPLKQLVETTGLRFANLGLGIRPTWSYQSVLLSAPIDHILVSPEWQVRAYEVGREVGSDHLPVMAELVLR